MRQTWTCGTCAHTLHADIDGPEDLDTIRHMGSELMTHTWEHAEEAA
jgi:hypothetical protein